jgi:hypothetical protein
LKHVQGLREGVKGLTVSRGPKKCGDHEKQKKKDDMILKIILGDIHILRNAIFQLFRPPSLIVTKNRTNPYALTMVCNKSLTPSPLERYVICGRPLILGPKLQASLLPKFLGPRPAYLL